MKESKDLIKALREMLKNNLVGSAGTALLEQMARASSDMGRDKIVVSVYARTEDEFWEPYEKPLHEFSFSPGEYELVLQAMKAYPPEEFDVSILFGDISKEAINGVQLSPYFEFMSSHAPVDHMLSGTKSEYVGEA